MRLYICEKPSQAKDVAAVLAATKREDGFYSGNQSLVTWCFGHLLEMAAPEAYDPAWKVWRLDALPLVPTRWKMQVIADRKKQFNVIQRLLSTVSDVCISTDADREGECIAREILELCQYRGAVSRLWLRALDPVSIQQALNNILPDHQTKPLYYAALARARADWLVGMNLSRGYTTAAKEYGANVLLSVGRVQTPTLKLVVDRDRAIQSFVPVPYYDVVARCVHNGSAFNAKWDTKRTNAQVDESGRCLAKSHASQVTNAVNSIGRGTVVKSDKVVKTESAPLPFSLSSLQQKASATLGFGAQQVLDLAQALYETHKLTSYPRTDCGYLPESQLADAAQVVPQLIAMDPSLSAITPHLNLAQKSKAWNDKKVTAHHGIIPTAVKVDLKQLSGDELALYQLIRDHYLMQFLPLYQFEHSVLEINAGGFVFVASGNVPVNLGWRLLQGATQDNGELLPSIKQGESVSMTATVEEKRTKAPAYYTEGTLIQAMQSVANLIDDPVLSKMMKGTGGIGQESTRASIIETLLKRGFVVKDGKHIKSSENGRNLIALLPDAVTNPATTAIWEQALEAIAANEYTLDDFMQNQTAWIQELVNQLKHAPSLLNQLEQLKFTPNQAQKTNAKTKKRIIKKQA